MKNILPKMFAGAALITASTSANAQLADGSIAPDFTFTDLGGTSHHLYDYLDNGYTVFLDFSAAWCGPCWSYHNTHALRDLYENHGPAGFPSVVGGTTDDVMVIFMEGEQGNTGAQITGTSGSGVLMSQGDWTAGTTYPIIDVPSNAAGNACMNGYEIGYFPTIYKVCPNRTITEVGQANATALYASVSSCPAPASMPTDAALLTLPGILSQTCNGSTLPMKVRLQNNGTATLTSALIEAKIGSTVVGSTTYSGTPLNTYDYADVTVGTSPAITSATTITYVVTASGDGTTSNDTKTQSVTVSSLAPTSSLITVNITTDRYGSETTWELTNSAGTVVGSGGPYANLSANGTQVQPAVNLVLPADCYGFVINDAYGDGMCCSYGAGAYALKITGAGSNFTTGGTFGESETKKFKTQAGTAGEFEIFTEDAITVYPNPTSQDAFVDINLVNGLEVTINVVNSLGESVMTTTKEMGAGYNNEKISFSHLPTGMYYVNVLAGNKSVIKKISVVK